MIEILKTYGLPLMLAAIAGISGYFNGTGAAKEATVTETTKHIVALEKVDVVQDERDINFKEDLKEIKSDVKEIKQLFYEERGWNKPAIVPQNAPIITGVKKDGKPKNE